MIKPAFEILNQRGTPMFFSDVFANRPAPGIIGRIFISTDTNLIYRDTGTTWNLIGGGTATIGGTIAAGQVAYGTALNTIGGTGSFVFDDLNNRLGVGGSASNALTITAQTVGDGIVLKGQTGLNIFSVTRDGTSANTSELFQYAGGSIRLAIRNTSNLSYFNGGNFAFGSTTDTGETLQVTGTIRSNPAANNNGLFINNYSVTGTSGSSALLIQGTWNTTGSPSALLVNINVTNATNTSYIANFQANGTHILRIQRQGTVEINNAISFLNNDIVIRPQSTNGITDENGFIISKVQNPPSGNRINYSSNSQFNPNTGTATFVNFQASGNINQTGGANGITRGLYVNPTLTAAADWRSIEWSNNSGWGLYGAGTANNYLAGSLGIGSTSLTGITLRVGKNITGATSSVGVASNGAIQSDVTSNAILYNASAFSNTSGFTTTNLYHYLANRGTISHTVTNGYGFFVDTTLDYATNNYGFYGNIASGTGRWNLYMNGTANNYLGGDLLVQTTSPTGGYAIKSNTGIYAVGNLRFDNGLRDNRDNTIITQSLSSLAANRILTLANGTYINVVIDSPRLLLGGTTDSGERLQVTGTQKLIDTRTYSTGAIQSSRLEKNLTIPSGASISGGSTISNEVLAGTTTIQGNINIPNSSPFAGIYASNLYSFSAGSLTLTSSQAAGTRAISQIAAQNYFGGSFSGTFTDVASMQIGAFLNNSTGSITPVITNAYQLLINDINEASHTFTIANRWGIYQEGTSDRNYLKAKTLIGSNTDTGEQFQLTGDIRINNQLSGTAGGSSGQHLIINCDGTIYKIALLNN